MEEGERETRGHRESEREREKGEKRERFIRSEAHYLKVMTLCQVYQPKLISLQTQISLTKST